MNRRTKLKAVLLFFLLPLSLGLGARPQEKTVITLALENVRLSVAMDAIMQQSRYLFANKDVDLDRTVTVSVKEVGIREACDAIFKPLDVVYTIEDYNIIISNASDKESVEISGTVVDASGYPVPGAAVLEIGTMNGTTTDLDGKFVLKVGGVALLR